MHLTNQEIFGCPKGVRNTEVSLYPISNTVYDIAGHLTVEGLISLVQDDVAFLGYFIAGPSRCTRALNCGRLCNPVSPGCCGSGLSPPDTS